MARAARQGNRRSSSALLRAAIGLAALGVALLGASTAAGFVETAASRTGAQRHAIGSSAPGISVASGVARNGVAIRAAKENAAKGKGHAIGSSALGISVAAGVARDGVAMRAAKKKAATGTGDPISDGDTVYIKVMTGRYIGELDGTSRKEWVKARGTKKDKDHALTIEKAGGGEIESGDTIRLVMPLSVTNGTKIHMDVCGSAVRARYYDPRGEWQKIVIVKQTGGVIRDGDTIFLRSVFKNGRDYLDANPLESFADGEVKCRWPDEGEYQVMTIEK